MGDIVAPDGSPLGVAVLGTLDLDRASAFYRDIIGLEPGPPIDWSGEEFERYWHLPAGASAKGVLLHAGPDPVGRVLLLDFDAPDRRQVRDTDAARAYGLFNLNFYTEDIVGDSERLGEMGYDFWSQPTAHDLSAATGTPIEVVFEGPDGVAINLVELATKDPATRIGQMRAFVKKYGHTSTGFTPVVTSSHGMHSLEKGLEFYQQVLKMGIVIDEVLGTPESNRFLRLNDDAKTQITFMQGNHMFGKVVMSQPLNYECGSMSEIAVPPNAGYLAQSFAVTDLDAAAGACEALGVEVFTPATRIDLPAFGPSLAMIVKNPGSGALQEIVQPLG